MLFSCPLSLSPHLLLQRGLLRIMLQLPTVAHRKGFRHAAVEVDPTALLQLEAELRALGHLLQRLEELVLAHLEVLMATESGPEMGKSKRKAS